MGPALLVLVLSIVLVICGILMAISASMFSSAKLIEEFEPARDKKDLGSSAMLAVTVVLFVTGLWGMATYKIKNRVFVSIFGMGASALAVICGGAYTAFNALANLTDE